MRIQCRPSSADSSRSRAARSRPSRLRGTRGAGGNSVRLQVEVAAGPGGRVAGVAQECRRQGAPTTPAIPTKLCCRTVCPWHRAPPPFLSHPPSPPVHAVLVGVLRDEVELLDAARHQRPRLVQHRLPRLGAELAPGGVHHAARATSQPLALLAAQGRHSESVLSNRARNTPPQTIAGHVQTINRTCVIECMLAQASQGPT